MSDSNTASTSPSSRGSSGVFIGVLGLTVGIAGLAAGGFALEKLTRVESQIADQAQLREVAATQDSGFGRILKSQSATIRAQQQDVTLLKAEIVGLHDALSKRDSATVNPEDVAALVKEQLGDTNDIASRLAALEKTPSETETQDEHVVESALDDADIRAVRFSLLQDLVRSGKPYDEALDRFSQSLGDGIAEQPTVRDALVFLKDAKEIPSAASLYRSLSGIPTRIREKETPYAPASDSKSWWERSGDSFKGLVKVEKIEGDISIIDSIDQARALAKLGGIGDAVSVLSALPDAEQDLYSDWLEAAKRHQAGEDALAVLRAATLVASEPSAAPAKD